MLTELFLILIVVFVIPAITIFPDYVNYITEVKKATNKASAKYKLILLSENPNEIKDFIEEYCNYLNPKKIDHLIERIKVLYDDDVIKNYDKKIKPQLFRTK